MKNSISHSFGDVIWIKISPKSGRLLSFCSQQSAGIRRSDIAVWCALHGSRPNKKHILAECPHDVFITKYHQSFVQIQNHQYYCYCLTCNFIFLHCYERNYESYEGSTGELSIIPQFQNPMVISLVPCSVYEP